MQAIPRGTYQEDRLQAGSYTRQRRPAAATLPALDPTVTDNREMRPGTRLANWSSARHGAGAGLPAASPEVFCSGEAAFEALGGAAPAAIRAARTF